MQCEIQWIDGNGQYTPDSNEAIGLCWMIAHPYIRDDLSVYMVPESKKMAICADHAKRLTEVTHHWPVWTLELFVKDNA